MSLIIRINFIIKLYYIEIIYQLTNIKADKENKK